MSEPIQIKGFTNATLDWKAWLDVVDPATATSEQIAVLEESNVKAKVSDYYLLLLHQTHILHQRSIAFNAIMYAPGGLSRAERELGSLVTSRINGCVFALQSTHSVLSNWPSAAMWWRRYLTSRKLRGPRREKKPSSKPLSR